MNEEGGKDSGKKHTDHRIRQKTIVPPGVYAILIG
jgi:hypothetical protein